MELYITWIHILFFSTWLGANLFSLAIFLPASTPLPPDGQWSARSRASHGLNTVTAVSAPPVLITGFAWFLLPGPQAGLGPAWGVLSIIAIKFILTLAMIINHWRQAFRYAPKLASDQHAHSQASDQREVAWKAWVRLLTINVVLGFVVFCLGLLLE